jgi:hypothetical protein
VTHAQEYTSELIADGKRRWDEGEESVASIAASFAVSERYMRRLAIKLGWGPRPKRKPQDLSPVLRALAEVDALQLGKVPAVTAQPAAAEARPETNGNAPVGSSTDREAVIERLLRAVDIELAVVERMRASLGSLPQEPAEAERTARTLATHARTLREVQRIRGAASLPAGTDDDDNMPADIDEFRRELARRIHAFVDTRTGGRVDDGEDEPEDGPSSLH